MSSEDEPLSRKRERESGLKRLSVRERRRLWEMSERVWNSVCYFKGCKESGRERESVWERERQRVLDEGAVCADAGC